MSSDIIAGKIVPSPEFSDWVRSVLKEMEQIGEHSGRSGGVLVDAAIPYRMGLTPKAAALAMLNIDQRMRKRLDAVVTQEEDNMKKRRQGLGRWLRRYMERKITGVQIRESINLSYIPDVRG